MSSDWQPPRTPLFGIALIPPPSVGEEGEAEEIPPSVPPASCQPAVSNRVEPPPEPHVSRAESGGWTAVAVSQSVPAVIAAASETDADLWPEKWLHPAERRALARFAPHQRRQALALLTAARRALVEALSVPEPATASADLSPLLDGVQSLRFGDWTLQRVPAPRGLQVVAAAPGAGWSYFLLQPPAEGGH